MSQFFKALEQAERERALRDQAGYRKGDPPPIVRDAAAGEPSQPLSMGQSERVELQHPTTVARPAVKSSDGIEPHLVSLLAPTTFEAEQYRTLRQLVEQMHREANLCTVAVSSPSSRDGKTITAINLAGALAQAPETRVLLVDADLRRPSLSKLLGLGDSGNPGLVDAILKPRLTLEDVVRPCPSFNRLAVISSGPPPTPPYEVLKSARLGELLQEARKRYDYIVLDTPPLIPFPDCRLIAEWTDGFLVVVAAHKTPRKLVEEAINNVDPAKMVGLIFNNDDRPVFGYYSDYTSHPSPNGDRRGWLSRRHSSE